MPPENCRYCDWWIWLPEQTDRDGFEYEEISYCCHPRNPKGHFHARCPFVASSKVFRGIVTKPEPEVRKSVSMNQMYVMDLTQIPKSDGKNFETIPAGKYPAMLTHTEVKRTKDGQGLRVELTIEIIDGQYRGRKIFDGLNIFNPSKPENQKISQGVVRALAEAVGASLAQMPQDLEPCKLKPCLVQTRIEKGKDGYPDRNRIVTFHSMQSGGAGPAWQAPATQPALPNWTNQQPTVGPNPGYNPGNGYSQPTTATQFHPPQTHQQQWQPPQTQQQPPALVAPTHPAVAAATNNGAPQPFPWQSKQA